MAPPHPLCLKTNNRNNQSLASPLVGWITILLSQLLEVKMISRRRFTLIGLGAASFLKPVDVISSMERTSRTPDPGPGPRRVGVRSDGSYWGHGSEHIDVFSGNLNFSKSLLSLNSRSFQVNLAAAYNSQIWKLTNEGLEAYGFDVGYGFGWRLQLGSIVQSSSR